MKPKRPTLAVPYPVSKEVKRRSGGMCEIMRQPGCLAIATDMAHRHGQGVGGLDTEDNVMHACRICHQYSGEHKFESYEKGWQIRTTSPAPQPDKIPVLYRGIWMLLTKTGGTKPYVPPTTKGPDAVTATPTIPDTRTTFQVPTAVEVADRAAATCLNCDPKLCDGAVDSHRRFVKGSTRQVLECARPGCGCKVFRREVTW